jgi:putative antitoxin of VapBC-like toxin-antitoxin system
MRTTIRLDDELLAEAKQQAARSGSTLTAVIEQALREMLQRRREMRSLPPVEIPTWGHGGLQPGVNLDNSAALIDLLEAEDGPA